MDISASLILHKPDKQKNRLAAVSFLRVARF